MLGQKFWGGSAKVCSALVALGALSGGAWAQQELVIAAFPAVDEIVKGATAQWKQLHPNVSLKIVSRQFADHHTAMTTALSTSFYLPDVMALEVGYVGRFAQGGGLEDLSQPPYNVAQYKSRFVPYAYAQATSRDGKVVAVPTDIGPGTLLYRNDLLTKAGVTPEELTKSWAGYVAAGVKIKAKTGAYLLAHARDMKDIVIRTGIQPGEGLYFDKNSQVLVTSPRFVRAFELARDIRANKLDAKVSTWSNEWSEGFKRGTLATQMSGAWLAGHLANWIAPDTKGLWRAGPLPEKAWGSWGGTFYAIPKAAHNKALAWAFVQMMTLNPEVQLSAFKSQDAFPALVSVHEDVFFDEPIAFLGGQKARVLWRDAASRVSPVDSHRLDPVAEEIVNAEMDNVLDKGKSVKAALADAKRLIEERLAK